MRLHTQGTLVAGRHGDSGAPGDTRAQVRAATPSNLQRQPHWLLKPGHVHPGSPSHGPASSTRATIWDSVGTDIPSSQGVLGPSCSGSTEALRSLQTSSGHRSAYPPTSYPSGTSGQGTGLGPSASLEPAEPCPGGSRGPRPVASNGTLRAMPTPSASPWGDPLPTHLPDGPGPRF